MGNSQYSAVLWPFGRSLGSWSPPLWITPPLSPSGDLSGAKWFLAVTPLPSIYPRELCQAKLQYCSSGRGHANSLLDV